MLGSTTQPLLQRGPPLLLLMLLMLLLLLQLLVWRGLPNAHSTLFLLPQSRSRNLVELWENLPRQLLLGKHCPNFSIQLVLGKRCPNFVSRLRHAPRASQVGTKLLFDQPLLEAEALLMLLLLLRLMLRRRLPGGLVATG